jgi:hypothetical protein
MLYSPTWLVLLIDTKLISILTFPNCNFSSHWRKTFPAILVVSHELAHKEIIYYIYLITNDLNRI